MVQLAHGLDGFQSLNGCHFAPFGTFHRFPLRVGCESSQNSLKPWLLLHVSEYIIGKEFEKAPASSRVSRIGSLWPVGESGDGQRASLTDAPHLENYTQLIQTLFATADFRFLN